MQKISFRDHAFLPDDCHLYDLTVHCSSDGLSILILRPDPEPLLFCEHFPFANAGYQMLLRKVTEWKAGHEFLNRAFRKTTILFGDRQVFLVPETLFSEKLSEFLLSAGKREEVETESIVISLQQMGANLVFRTGMELFETLNLIFPGAEVTHEVVPLLRHVSSNPDSRLHFHMHSSWFYALGVKEGKLEFINSFETGNETDMLYFMLSVIKEFHHINHPVVISGFIDPEDSRFILIRKNLPGAIPADQYNGNPLPDRGWTSRYFYGLLQEYSCA